eukprot:XP_011613502.1 PREDICTED: multivesicular body subunit 12B [Takifugu rubripes]
MSEESSRLPAEPISAVGVLASISQGPDGYYVVAKTTDGNDADLWKDGIFKSKVTRYLCFKRENGPDVVVDMRMIDAKDALPQGFTPVEKTEDTGETAMRKRKLCVKTSPRAAAKTAVYDIQITAKSKYQLIDYKCLCEMNNMVIWYRTGDVPQPSSQETSIKVQCDGQAPPVRRRNSSRPDLQHQGSGNYTMTALDDVPFIVSQNLFRVQEQMQQVNLMGITIKSRAEIEKEFHYNFSTERSIAD